MTQTPFGYLSVVLKCAAISAAHFVFASVCFAQDVSITTPDGGVSLTGRFLGFDGRYLRLETAAGEVTLDYSGVICTGQDCPDPSAFAEIVRFSGTERLGAQILPALLEGYAFDRGLRFERSEIPGAIKYALTADGNRLMAQFSFRLTTTEDGFADLLAQESDIVMAARPIDQAELDLVRNAGLGRLDRAGHVRILAFDALVPIVSPMSPIYAVDLTELARAFSGEITNWTALGGPDAPIHLYLGDPGGGLAQGFMSQVLAATDRQLSPLVEWTVDDDALIDAVTRDPLALGVASFEAVGNAVPLRLAGPCGLTVSATQASVRTGDYPLTMPLFLYLPERRLGPVVQGFMDWLSTSSAQLVLRRIGVPGQEPVASSIAEQGERLAAAIDLGGPEVGLGELRRMVGTMQDHVRLSPTFRFDEGAATLDPASQSHVRTVAQSIRDGRHQGLDLLLIGFSDGEGPAFENRVLSTERAESVQDAILSLLGGTLPEGVTLSTIGFGEAMPMGCDSTIWGRRTNRRVELWAPARRTR